MSCESQLKLIESVKIVMTSRWVVIESTTKISTIRWVMIESTNFDSESWLNQPPKFERFVELWMNQPIFIMSRDWINHQNLNGSLSYDWINQFVLWVVIESTTKIWTTRWVLIESTNFDSEPWLNQPPEFERLVQSLFNPPICIGLGLTILHIQMPHPAWNHWVSFIKGQLTASGRALYYYKYYMLRPLASTTIHVYL